MTNGKSPAPRISDHPLPSKLVSDGSSDQLSPYRRSGRQHRERLLSLPGVAAQGNEDAGVVHSEELGYFQDRARGARVLAEVTQKMGEYYEMEGGLRGQFVPVFFDA